MTIEYKGKNIGEGRKNPEAYITYDKNIEQKKADRVFYYLKGNGWRKVKKKVGYIVIPLVHKDEFFTLVSQYKIAKKLAESEEFNALKEDVVSKLK